MPPNMLVEAGRSPRCAIVGRAKRWLSSQTNEAHESHQSNQVTMMFKDLQGPVIEPSVTD